MSEVIHAAITGEPEVVEDAEAAEALPGAAWASLKTAVAALRMVQAPDGSLADGSLEGGHTETISFGTGVDARALALELVRSIIRSLGRLSHEYPHDAPYLAASAADFERWADTGFGVPDFFDSLGEFHPEKQRVDGRRHVVVFPMFTQNGSTERLFEAVLVEVIWPEFIAELEAGDFSNALFVPIRFVDFTDGYDTNSAVLFPETIAMRAIPAFTWGAIFADREAARFRLVVRAAAEITRLELPVGAQQLLDNQELAEETFVMWDLIHDRTHMRGDLPFDPFMIKQRMPFFLYSLEELRCDLTAFREAVRIEREAEQNALHDRTQPHSATAIDTAKRVQYAIIFDRIFRFAITGSRVRNYDGLGGQLLFAWLHQHHVLHWTDTRLTIDWADVADQVIALGAAIDDLYWRSIDRPKMAHWLAAYDLVSSTVTPHPASVWAKGPDALPLDGPPRGLTDAVLPDEFPLSMFYEALSKKMTGVIESTAGITGVR